MAQVKRSSGARTKRNLKRAGILGPRGVAFVCVGLALAVAIGAFVHLSQNSGVLVSHGDNQGETLEQAGSEATDSGTSSEANEGSSSEGNGTSGGTSSEVQGSSAEKAASITVHVDGAVATPGVYTLTQSPARTIDAVEAAGGLTAEANTDAVNLAQALDDGTKVHIPTWGEAVEETATSAAAGASSPASAASSGGSSSGAASTGSGGKVNINTATADELTSLPGVGPSTAKAIVDDRTKNGKFTSVEDLMRVSGIGEKKFAKLKDSIRV